MTSKRQSLGCPKASAETPSIKTLIVNNDSSNANCSSDLYEQAYAAACKAVRHDRLGEFEKAKAEYKRVIEVNLLESSILVQGTNGLISLKIFNDLLHGKT